MKTLRIIISRPDKFKVGELKEIHRFSVEYDESVTIDFNILLKALKILYPVDYIGFKIV